MERKKLTRSTAQQINVMIDYMSLHRNFANGEFNGPMGQRAHLEQWKKLKEQLDEHGPTKSVEQWRHTWRDLKKRSRDEGAKINKLIAQTGNLDNVPKISEQTKKVLSIIGRECAFGLQNVQETGIGELLVVGAATAVNVPFTSTTPANTPIVGAATAVPNFNVPSTSTTPANTPIVGAATAVPNFNVPSTSTTPANTPIIFPQPTTAPQRARSQKRSVSANDFLKMDERKQAILKDLNTTLQRRNQISYLEARRNHALRLRALRTNNIFKF